MDPETGQFVVVAITAAGGLAWLAGLSAIVWSSRESRATDERFAVDGLSATATIVGEAEVNGEPEELSERLAGQLARDGGGGPFGPVKIIARDRREVAFEPAGPASFGLRRGRVRLTSQGTRTRVDYAIETSPAGILRVGWVALGLGLAALILIPWFMFARVVANPDPGVRWQALQTLQVAQLLWPPFLIAYLARQPARMFRARMDALIRNLPFS